MLFTSKASYPKYELFGVKQSIFLQNRYMIGLGLFALVLCLTYLVAWSITGKSKNTYVALDDRDQLVSKKKASRWE